MGSVGMTNTIWALSPLFEEAMNPLMYSSHPWMVSRFSLGFTGSYTKFGGFEKRAMHEDVSESRGVRRTRRRVTLYTIAAALDWSVSAPFI